MGAEEIIGVQTDDTDVGIVEVPSMLFEILGSILRQVEIAKVVGRVGLVVAQDRVERDMGHEVVGRLKESLCPLIKAPAVVHEVTGNKDEA